MPDVWDNIGNVDKPNAGADKLQPGIYPALEIISVKEVKGHHGHRFIVDLKVLAEAQSNGDKDPTEVGRVRSWSVKVDGTYANIGLGEARAFVAAAMGRDFESVGSEEIRNAFKGALNTSRVSATVWSKTTGQGHEMIKASFGESSFEGEAPAPKVEPPAAPPAAPPTPKEALKADPYEGYIVHPDNASWFYHPGTSDMVEASKVNAARA